MKYKMFMKCRESTVCQFHHADVLNYGHDVLEATKVRREEQHMYLIESIEKVAD